MQDGSVNDFDFVPIDTSSALAVDADAAPYVLDFSIDDATFRYWQGSASDGLQSGEGESDAECPFPSQQLERTREQVAALRSEYQPYLLAGGVTGLPTLLNGDLGGGHDAGSPELTALAFLERYAYALSGVAAPHVRPDWDTLWNQDVWENVRQIRFDQVVACRFPTSDRTVSVWGGVINFSFDGDDRLAVISNSLLPIQDDVLSFPLDPPAVGELLDRIALELPAVVQTSQAQGENGAWDFVAIDLQVNQHGDAVRPVIFPAIGAAGQPLPWRLAPTGWARDLTTDDDSSLSLNQQGELRAAFGLIFADQFRIPWLCIVDAESLMDVHSPARILYVAPAAVWAGNSKPCVVLRTDQQALCLYDTVAAAGQTNNLDDLTTLVQELTFPVPFGQAADGTDAQSLNDQTFVRFDGLRLSQPDYPPHAIPNLAYYLGPNLLYHLACASAAWERWLRLARIATWPSRQGDVTPLQHVTVILDDAYGGPRYDLATRQFVFPPGDAATIREPGFDGDVIAHEYAHAIMHFLAAPLFVPNYWNDTACAALDEGLAFYWACAQYGDPDWAVFAYSSSWRARRDLTQAPAGWSLIDWYGSEDAPHAAGIWWAGVLWRLHQQLGAAELRAALLKLLYGLATVQPDRIEAGSPRARMKAVFRVIADNLLMHLPQPVRPTAKKILAAAFA